jgi:hypothetical protein
VSEAARVPDEAREARDHPDELKAARHRSVMARAEAREKAAALRLATAEHDAERLKATQELVGQLDGLQAGALTKVWIVERLRDVASAAAKAGDLGVVRSVLRDLAEYAPPDEIPTADEREVLIGAVAKLGRDAVEAAAQRLGLTTMDRELAERLTKTEQRVSTEKRAAFGTL